jgi:cysteine-rich repeat protein
MDEAIEQCDDGNLISGDGCSKDCKIEQDYTCIGGSEKTKDKCKYN